MRRGRGPRSNLARTLFISCIYCDLRGRVGGLLRAFHRAHIAHRFVSGWLGNFLLATWHLARRVSRTNSSEHTGWDLRPNKCKKNQTSLDELQISHPYSIQRVFRILVPSHRVRTRSLRSPGPSVPRRWLGFFRFVLVAGHSIGLSIFCETY